MIRQTSIDAYNEIKQNGLLSKLRWRVYDYLFNNGPCTAKQLIRGIASPMDNTGIYATRLSELRDRGVVCEVGTIICPYTNHTVILWDVTSKLPKKVKKKQKQICLMCGQTIKD